MSVVIHSIHGLTGMSGEAIVASAIVAKGTLMALHVTLVRRWCRNRRRSPSLAR